MRVFSAYLIICGVRNRCADRKATSGLPTADVPNFIYKSYRDIGQHAPEFEMANAIDLCLDKIGVVARSKPSMAY
jgi:hypothetical protein